MTEFGMVALEIPVVIKEDSGKNCMGVELWRMTLAHLVKPKEVAHCFGDANRSAATASKTFTIRLTCAELPAKPQAGFRILHEN